MSNILTDIGHKIKVAFQKVGHAFAAVFVAVFGADAAKNFAQAAEAILASEFGKVVLTTVEGLMAVAASQGGAAARKAAFTAIASAAKRAGLDLKDSLINLLIELALQKLKGTYAALSNLTVENPPTTS